MLNIAEERPFHLQIYIGAIAAILVLAFGPLIRPETGAFGSPFHIAIVTSILLAWGILAYTRNENVFRLCGLTAVLSCALGFRVLLTDFGPSGDYWRFVVFTMIMIDAAVLFSRFSDYIAVTTLVAGLCFVGLDPAYFEAVGRKEFVIGMVSSLVTGCMLNIIVMSSYKKLFKAKESYKLLSRTDPLTRCLNRRALTEELAELRRKHANRSMLVAMIDLDHFKLINDTFGHETGDKVLVAISECLQRHFPHMVGRMGGEDFAILLPGMSGDEALAKLTALLVEVRDLQVSGVFFSFSAGLVAAGPTEDIGAVLSRADRVLYKAKAQGRNCIEWCEDLPVSPASRPVVAIAPTRQRQRQET